MKQFFILIFIMFFLKNFSQKVTFEYKVEHKFDIIDDKFCGDSICISLIAKNILLNDSFIKKDTLKNNFYFYIKDLDKINKKKLFSFIYHEGYSIKGKYKKENLTLNFTNNNKNYSENINLVFGKNIRHYSFKDEINFKENISSRITWMGINTIKIKKIIHINKIKEEDKFIYYYIKNSNDERYTIKLNKELNKHINTQFFHPEIEYGIEAYENIYSKYTLIDYKIKD